MIFHKTSPWCQEGWGALPRNQEKQQRYSTLRRLGPPTAAAQHVPNFAASRDCRCSCRAHLLQQCWSSLRTPPDLACLGIPSRAAEQQRLLPAPSGTRQVPARALLERVSASPTGRWSQSGHTGVRSLWRRRSAPDWSSSAVLGDALLPSVLRAGTLIKSVKLNPRLRLFPGVLRTPLPHEPDAPPPRAGRPSPTSRTPFPHEPDAPPPRAGRPSPASRTPLPHEPDALPPRARCPSPHTSRVGPTAVLAGWCSWGGARRPRSLGSRLQPPFQGNERFCVAGIPGTTGLHSFIKKFTNILVHLCLLHSTSFIRLQVPSLREYQRRKKVPEHDECERMFAAKKYVLYVRQCEKHRLGVEGFSRGISIDKREKNFSEIKGVLLSNERFANLAVPRITVDSQRLQRSHVVEEDLQTKKREMMYRNGK
ncbi:uncharacterized protein LOC128930066 [Callithrix jacchus]